MGTELRLKRSGHPHRDQIREIPNVPRPLLDLGRLLHLVTLLHFADLIGKFLNRPEIGRGSAIWVVPALRPMLQGLERDSEGSRKHGLAHAKPLSDRFRISKLNDRSAGLVELAVDMRRVMRRRDPSEQNGESFLREMPVMRQDAGDAFLPHCFHPYAVGEAVLLVRAGLVQREALMK